MKEIQQPQHQRRRGIGRKVGLVVILMQMVSVFFAVAMCVTMFRSLTTGILEERCVNGTDMLSYLLSQSQGGVEMDSLLDQLKDRMGCEFTIFEGDTRAYTTVVQNGKRATGTKLSSDLSSMILQQGKSFVGEATILNEEYLASYVPTRDENGKINGLLFAGISVAEANRQTFNTIVASSVVSLGIIIVCSLIMAAYLKKTVSSPLAEITQVARRLVAGNLGLSTGEEVNINVRSQDEIGELAVSFNRMADAIARNVQELEAAARRQEDFTGSFVHELKTPLTSIIGYADMLRSRDLGEDMRFKAASYIFSEGKRLESLSLSLMNLLVVGRSKAEARTVNMRKLCAEAARISQPAMKAKGLALTVRAEEGAVRGDGALLQTLLQNLLDNARKATASGGRVVLTGRSRENGYQVTVADQGRGIPDRELNKITEPFYMVDKSRSRAEGGAGLGLALCKEIAELHQGHLRFESQEGKGTIVTVMLGGVADA